MTGFDSKRQMVADKMQEPVAWKFYLDGCNQVVLDEDSDPLIQHNGTPLYTTPPQREWVGLTAEETSGFTQHEMVVAKYVSKVLQEKNNGT